MIEFLQQFLNQELAIDARSGPLRRLALVMRAAVLGPFDQRPQFILEGAITLSTSHAAMLAKLREAHPARAAGFVDWLDHGRRAGRGPLGSSTAAALKVLRDHELREQLVDGLLAGRHDACLLRVGFAKVDFLLDAAANGHLMHHGRLVAQIARVAAPYELNLSNALVRAWQKYLPGVAWVLPKSHWSFELHHAQRPALHEALRTLQIDIADLAPLPNAAAIAFEPDEADTFGPFVETILAQDVASDFAVLFPNHPAVVTLHHHKHGHRLTYQPWNYSSYCVFCHGFYAFTTWHMKNTRNL